MPILIFLNSTAGRWTRAIVGIALIALGAILGGWWWLLAAPGLLFLTVGALDVCPISVMAGKPFSGKKFRESLKS
ncbi:MAG: DUF2892 domain-containing protein [Leucobacter sp.]|nr:DUF2892 domain-containing protein [Leucobacter sp.]